MADTVVLARLLSYVGWKSTICKIGREGKKAPNQHSVAQSTKQNTIQNKWNPQAGEGEREDDSPQVDCNEPGAVRQSPPEKKAGRGGDQDEPGVRAGRPASGCPVWP